LPTWDKFSVVVLVTPWLQIQLKYIDSDATISEMSLSEVPIDEIPPPVLDAQEEKVAAVKRNKEVEVPKKLL
jgi:hypothetical protein